MEKIGHNLMEEIGHNLKPSKSRMKHICQRNRKIQQAQMEFFGGGEDVCCFF